MEDPRVAQALVCLAAAQEAAGGAARLQAAQMQEEVRAQCLDGGSASPALTPPSAQVG